MVTAAAAEPGRGAKKPVKRSMTPAMRNHRPEDCHRVPRRRASTVAREHGGD